MRKIFAAVICALISTSAFAQGLGNGSGLTIVPGSGGTGGSVTLNTVCPTTSSTGSTVTLNGQATIEATNTSGAYTIATTDCGKVVPFNLAGGTTVTLPATGVLPQGYVVTIANVGASGNITVNANGSGKINAASSLTIAPQTTATIYAVDANGLFFEQTNYSGSALSLAGSSGAIQTNNGSGNFGSIAPGTNVATALANNTEATGSFVRQNGAITTGNLTQWSASGAQDSGIVAANVGPAPVPASGNQTQLYPLWSGVTVTTGAVAPSQNIARCQPFYAAVAYHADLVEIDNTTGGTGPINFALYTDALDSTSKRHQPQALITNPNVTIPATISFQTAALGVAGTGVAVPQGLNWACINDTTAADAVRWTSIPATSSVISYLVGSTTATNVLSGTQLMSLTFAVTAGTTGTNWPSFIGTTFTDSTTNGAAPFIALRVVSVP